MTHLDPRELRAVAARLSATADAIEDGTWAFVIDAPDPRTPDALARQMGVTVQAANNRLYRLYGLGLVDRERIPVIGGGRQFAYKWRPEGPNDG